MKTLYEDQYCVAISKPANTHTQPTGNSRDVSIAQMYPQFFLVHRLDAHTSGVLLLAKTRYAASRFSYLFRSRMIQKKYLALSGIKTLHRIQTIWIDRLMKTNKGKVKIVSVGGLLAKTKVEIQPANNYSLLRLNPLTGRMHQLRVQATAHGFPILGDRLYGDISQDNKKRMFLHALSLEFVHPYTRKKIIINDRIPKEMKVFL
ncbi:MAG: RluA family pseudouridine synthase [Deltaproteobacteria bacterium]|nr:RluA family pseudouridine synthase [Deltaproteobacteria bacterium]